MVGELREAQVFQVSYQNASECLFDWTATANKSVSKLFLRNSESKAAFTPIF